MKLVLIAAAMTLSSALATSAMAQEVISSAPVPATAQATPGIPGPEAVDPAPGARGPYVGHPNAFYDVDARIDRVTQRYAAMPNSAAKRRAMSTLRSIRAEEATQKARHGELRDWDRENLNHRLDQLEQGMPAA